jgi:hypothetical protein
MEEVVADTLTKLREQGKRPEITRTTRKFNGYSVQNLRNFIKISNGHDVLYFSNKSGPVFHSLYKITSISGTPDYVTHPVRR